MKDASEKGGSNVTSALTDATNAGVPDATSGVPDATSGVPDATSGVPPLDGMDGDSGSSPYGASQSIAYGKSRFLR